MTEGDPEEDAGSADEPAGDPDGDEHDPGDGAGDPPSDDTTPDTGEHAGTDTGGSEEDPDVPTGEDGEEGADGDDTPVQTPAPTEPGAPDADDGTEAEPAGDPDDGGADTTQTGPGSVSGETPDPPEIPDDAETVGPDVDVPEAPGGTRPPAAPDPEDVDPMEGVGAGAGAGSGGAAPAGGGGGGGGGGLGGGPGAPDDQEMPLAAHIEEMVRRLGVVIVVMALVSAVVFPFADQLINFLWYSFLPGSVEACRPVAAAAANATNATVNATAALAGAPNGTAVTATLPNGTVLNGTLPDPGLVNASYPNGTTVQAVYPNGTSRNATLLTQTAPAAVDAACPRIYQPLALVLARLKMASLAGFVVGLPVFVYQTYLFMRPGLFPNERRYYLSSVPTSLVLAAVGIGFAYFLVLPVIFTYFLGYSQPVANIAFGLAETFDLIILMLGMFALVFQIPLFVMLAIFLGVTSRRWLESRRLYFWAAFAGIAFIFSPDPTGMAPFIVAATMVVLFEGTLLLLRWTGR